MQGFVVVRSLALLPQRRLAIDQIADRGRFADSKINAIEVRSERDESSGNGASARPELQCPLTDWTTLTVGDDGRFEPT